MNTIAYFPHDAEAHNDEKLLLVMNDLGLEGIGIYWMLIEILRLQSKYEASLLLIKPWSKVWSTQDVKIEAIIKNYGLFEINETKFFSPSLRKRMEPLEIRKQRWSEAGKKGRRKQIESSSMNSDTNSESTEISVYSGPPPGLPRALPGQDKIREDKIREDKIRKDDIVCNEIPNKKTNDDFLKIKKEKFKNTLSPYLKMFDRDRLNDFYFYWTEPNKSRTKLRWELEKTWDIERRLRRWKNFSRDFEHKFDKKKVLALLDQDDHK